MIISNAITDHYYHHNIKNINYLEAKKLIYFLANIVQVTVDSPQDVQLLEKRPRSKSRSRSRTWRMTVVSSSREISWSLLFIRSAGGMSILDMSTLGIMMFLLMRRMRMLMMFMSNLVIREIMRMTPWQGRRFRCQEVELRPGNCNFFRIFWVLINSYIWRLKKK